MEKNQPFKAISKICLNNWHYIDRKILNLSEGINFFTGHSGSGKSTVIDALQIVLYANTDGRAFFNKAAADDSDRSLIEYLRGMVNISENNESQYLRNKNFSSTIVLETEQTDTKEKQCVGVAFDVETATNEIGRMFFWHTGGLLPNDYRGEKRCLTTSEIKDYLSDNFAPEQFYIAPTNERFRRQLYDIYLGGLDMEKFPRLFKRAIPFKMNIKLEDFVREYICMEQDIHIDDLKESVTLYGSMRNKIEQTLGEIRGLEEIKECYDEYDSRRTKVAAYEYQIQKLDILSLEESVKRSIDVTENRKAEIKKQKNLKAGLEEEAEAIQKEYDDIMARINSSGYEALKTQLAAAEEALERFGNSRARVRQISDALLSWKDIDIVSNQMIGDIDKFAKGAITKEELERLKEGLLQVRKELEEDRRELDLRFREIKNEEAELREELKELKSGHKTYPKELEEAKYELRTKLSEKYGRLVNVKFLAELLEIRDDRWHKAVEGYLGNRKLLLVVEPEYVKDAMDIYEGMDSRKFFRASVLDTEKVLGAAQRGECRAKAGALANEVEAKEDYVRAYVDFALGDVIKCENIEELRGCKIGITADCMLYQGFRLQHINPDSYTKFAYIGKKGMLIRKAKLEERCMELQNERLPIQEELEKLHRALQLESLSEPVSEYVLRLNDVSGIPAKERQKAQLIEKLQKLSEESVAELERLKQENLKRRGDNSRQISEIDTKIGYNESHIEDNDNKVLQLQAELRKKEQEFKVNAKFEEMLSEQLRELKKVNYESLKNQRARALEPLREEVKAKKNVLSEARSQYLQKYRNRTFSTTIDTNEPYDRLLATLSCDRLETYKEAAREQARSAVEHFKDDFIFKIRSAIRESYQRGNELNRIISGLDFGKDKYRFVITKNKGADGKYYPMFMDDSLQIDPSQLTDTMENQLNMFTMEHEGRYGDMMNELISIFIPPEGATREEMEEAKKNMDKYADYRTYLSFDMQQIVQGDKDMTIGLSKMIKKNSGGEGQNPLYVALLASFAQLYRINLSPKIRRNPTIRLVVLDEAFSKMDAEKVASCISLIRGLGFQAIISATNDKIQNYLENVDKTFVYANPNKKHISIQEFEKNDFAELKY